MNELGNTIEQVGPVPAYAMLLGAVDGDVKKKDVAGLTLDLLVKVQAKLDHLRQHLFIDGNVACFAKSLDIAGAESLVRMGRAPKAWWATKPCQT